MSSRWGGRSRVADPGGAADPALPSGDAGTPLRNLWRVALGLAVGLFGLALPARYDELAQQAATGRAGLADLPAHADGFLADLLASNAYPLTVLVLEIVVFATFLAVSAAIVWRQTDDRRALFFSAVFVLYPAWVIPTIDALHSRAGAGVLTSLVQAIGLQCAVSFFCLFPDGRFVPRWTRVNVIAWGVFNLSWGLFPAVSLSLIDPFAASLPAFWVLMIGGWGLGLLAQAIRYRREATSSQRRQTKWVMLAIAAAIFGYGAEYLPGVWIADAGLARIVYDLFAVPAFILAILPIAVALAVAMLRHHLFRVDLVINRAVVFGGLAAFITAVYVGIVVGIGNAIGRGDEPNYALSIVATAIVAVAFQPVRDSVQRFANRLVYGQRATPYEVLSTFSARMGSTVASEELLPQMARILGEGTGAAEAGVWLRLGDGLRLAASWPASDADVVTAPLVGDRLPVFDGVDVAVPVTHNGELLGALTVRTARGASLTSTEETLTTDLAAQAGLVLRNVGLTAELLRRLEELRASRQRLVAAQDAERRRLERDLHDGAQQQLIVLKLRMGIARSLTAAGKVDEATALLDTLMSETDETVEMLRALAHGIYPPLLASEGLVAALTSHAAKLPLSVEVRGDGVGRYPPDVEAAVYFCCLEALQNASKYAQADRVLVELRHAEGIAFTITDDGVGFEPETVRRGHGLTNLVDRVDALGGVLEVRSRPGAGTVISGSVPAGDGAAADAGPPVTAA